MARRDPRDPRDPAAAERPEDDPGPPDAAEPTGIRCTLGDVLADRGMTLTELSARTGVTIANLSVLKNDRARAVRFSTLAAICRVLDAAPGDILAFDARPPAGA